MYWYDRTVLQTICFLGESLFVTGLGLVHDWRHRRRYIGYVDYNVQMWLNKRSVRGGAE